MLASVVSVPSWKPFVLQLDFLQHLDDTLWTKILFILFKFIFSPTVHQTLYGTVHIYSVLALIALIISICPHAVFPTLG